MRTAWCRCYEYNQCKITESDVKDVDQYNYTQSGVQVPEAGWLAQGCGCGCTRRISVMNRMGMGMGMGMGTGKSLVDG